LKKGKASAEKTWKRMSESERELAINSIQRYVASVNPKYMKHGSTYLSQKTWEDDLSPVAKEGTIDDPKYDNFRDAVNLANELSEANNARGFITGEVR
jgi:hypothetical protein